MCGEETNAYLPCKTVHIITGRKTVYMEAQRCQQNKKFKK